MKSEIIKQEVPIEKRYVPIHILEREAKTYANEYTRIIKSSLFGNYAKYNKVALDIISDRIKQIEESIKVLKQLL